MLHQTHKASETDTAGTAGVASSALVAVAAEALVESRSAQTALVALREAARVLDAELASAPDATRNLVAATIAKHAAKYAARCTRLGLAVQTMQELAVAADERRVALAEVAAELAAPPEPCSPPAQADVG